jgi:SAM-dependent methyltransferase
MDHATGPVETPSAWAGEDYATASGHHRTFDDWFLDAHPPRSDDDIVDAGCGSGEFTARLADLAPEGSVVGVEPDRSMLAAACHHVADNLEFRQGRLQDLDHVCAPASADLVVSRSVFHWIGLDDYLRCYRAIRSVLRPGGWFHAESGGAGNVARVGGVLDEVAVSLGFEPNEVTFPDAGAALELLEQAGFEIPESGVTTVAQRRVFDHGQLLGFVRTQAAVAYGLAPGSDALERFVAGVDDRRANLERHDGSYDITFVRLHVRCRRPRTGH